MQDMPLVSVIIPVYKTERYLHRCIDSLVNQDYKNIEIILIDDGSPDHCGNICDEYAKKDKRIRVIHQENQGISAARNAGIKKSCGEYICFVDSDDYVDIHLLSTVIPQMIEKNADAAIFNAQIVHGNIHGEILGWNIRSREIQNDQIKQYLLQGYDSYVWRKIYKRNIWDNIIFPVGKKYEDLYIIAYLIKNINNIIAIPKTLYYYECEYHESITQNRDMKSLFNACEAWIANMDYVIGKMKEWYYLNAICIFIECIIRFDKYTDFYREFGNIQDLNLQSKYRKILQIDMHKYRILAYRFIQYRISVLRYNLFFNLQIENSDYWRRELSLHILRDAIRIYCINRIQNVLDEKDMRAIFYQLNSWDNYRNDLSLGRKFILYCIQKKYNIFLWYEGERLLRRKI